MRILKIMIISFFALLSATIQAKIPEKTIACPSVEMIHRVAPLLKEAYRTAYSTYQVEISDHPDNPGDRLPWFIMSYNIAASNYEEAVEIAQKRGANISNIVYPNARKGGLRNDEYSCLYYDGTLPNPFASIIAIAKNH